jgi:hypothetical protein
MAGREEDAGGGGAGEFEDFSFKFEVAANVVADVRRRG